MPRRGLNKNMIVDAAAELIESRGCARFSMNELASALKVRPSSLYNHVSGLGEVQSELGFLVIRMLRAMIPEDIAAQSAEEALLTSALTFRAFAKAHPELYRMLIYLPRGDAERLLKEGWGILTAMNPQICSLLYTQTDWIHFWRGMRSAMFGFITLESSGFFINPESTDESYLYMMRSFIRGFCERNVT